ncbi:type II toxin-antitoxin system HipA family toxin [Comamonas sp. SY3]|uniref:type II toxin-antitoxin system HipA family toxin n=1 Tax=Comamonas sp. SY3 TaxID=3243601 RepID=UPI0035931341
MPTISKRSKYAHPPEQVAVFAHVAGAGVRQQNAFVPAGMLENLAQDRSPTFAYGKKYVKRNNVIEVDPVALPLAGEQGGQQRHVLPGLSEFGGLRDAAPDAWGRRVIENKLRSGTLPEVAYLLEAGSNRVGALDVRLAVNSPQSDEAYGVVDLERLLDVADRIENDEPVPETFFHYFNGLGSAGGARPKATIRDEHGVLWLAKFPSKGDKACNAVLEAGALELARAAGLRVPPVKLLDIGSQRILLIRRFDRYWAEPGQVLAQGEESWAYDPASPTSGGKREEGRIAYCSALTLMGLHEHEAPSSSYADICQAIRKHVAMPFIDRDVKEIFQRMVFNIIANNNDDHLRNHAFIYDVAAKGWRLSPLYDVLPMNTVAHTRYLHLSVGDEGRVATLDNALSQWSAFHNSRAEAVEAMHHVWMATRASLEKFEQFGASERDLAYVRGAFRRLDDLASPALRRELRAL